MAGTAAAPRRYPASGWRTVRQRSPETGSAREGWGRAIATPTSPAPANRRLPGRQRRRSEPARPAGAADPVPLRGDTAANAVPDATRTPPARPPRAPAPGRDRAGEAA